MKVAVAGTGRVGLPNAVLLAQHNHVIAIDIMSKKIDMLNNKQLPIEDKEVTTFLSGKDLNLVATLTGCAAQTNFCNTRDLFGND